MDGIGYRMPWTMGAFAVGALSMIGMPMTAGFLGKWFMLTGAAGSAQWFAVGVIVLSTLLNAGYFLPVVYRAFRRPAGAKRRGHQGSALADRGRFGGDGPVDGPPVPVSRRALAARPDDTWRLDGEEGARHPARANRWCGRPSCGHSPSPALAVMALTVIVDAVSGHVSHFGIDGIVGAYAVIGLVSGFVIIGVAKGLGVPLSRPDTYYGDDETEAGK